MRNPDSALANVTKLLEDKPYTEHQWDAWYNRTFKYIISSYKRKHATDRIEQVLQLMKQNNIPISHELNSMHIRSSVGTGKVRKTTAPEGSSDEVLLLEYMASEQYKKAESIVSSKKDPQLYATIIEQYALLGKSNQVIHWYRELVQSKLAIEPRTYNHAILAYFQTNNVKQAIDVVMHDIKTLDSTTFETILGGISIPNVRLRHYAHIFFDTCMRCKLPVTPKMLHWVVLAFLENNMLEEMEHFVTETQKFSKISLKSHTMLDIISKYKIIEDATSENAKRWLHLLEQKHEKYGLGDIRYLVRAYFRMEEYAKAEELFNTSEYKQSMDYTFAIEDLAEIGNTEQAIHLLQEKHKNGYKIFVDELNAITNAFVVHEKDFQKGNKFLGEIYSKFGVQPNITTFNIFISEYCMTGNLQEATNMFNRLRNDRKLLPKPDSTTIDIMIMGYTVKNLTTEAEAFLKSLGDEIPLSQHTFRAMEGMYRRLRDYDNANRWLEKHFKSSGLLSDNTEVLDELLSWMKNKSMT
jgi:pentatricopeptide repeat protein